MVLTGGEHSQTSNVWVPTRGWWRAKSAAHRGSSASSTSSTGSGEVCRYSRSRACSCRSSVTSSRGVVEADPRPHGRGKVNDVVYECLDVASHGGGVQSRDADGGQRAGYGRVVPVAFGWGR
jgi:hypothetical protein